MSYFQALLGLAVIIAIAWLMSENRRRFPVRIVIAGLIVQFAIAIILLKVPVSQVFFLWVNSGILKLQQALQSGTSLVFGFLGGGDLPFQESYPGAAFVLAFQALPMVVLVSALSALLYHWRILPLVVKVFS